MNRAGVFFTGKKQNIIEFALSTRFSSRVTLHILQEKAETYEELSTNSKSIAWEKWIEPHQTFRIDAQTKDSLGNSQFEVHKLKDAILDSLSKKYIKDTIESRLYDKNGGAKYDYANFDTP